MSPISKAEPVTSLRRVKIVECGEPLLDFLQECPELRLDRPRFNYKRETLLRKSVLEKLCAANQSLLRRNLRIQVIEGWRPPFIQVRMYRWSWARFKEQHPDWSDVKLRRMVNRFTAPMNEKVPPPHTTGGAVDVALTDLKGHALDVITPYEQRDHRGFVDDAPLLSEQAKRHRQILAEAMLEVGITNYPSEYWHWSYGDQGWAYRGGHSNAIYAAVTPTQWTPDPTHLAEEPLTYFES